MKRNVLVYGGIGGLITAVWTFIALLVLPPNCGSTLGMVLGYTSMFIANIFLIIGVKNYRDKYSGGIITFGKALKVGLLITLFASTIYVVNWLIYDYATGSKFIEVYTESMHDQLVESGASPAVIAKQDAEMQDFMVMYRNPLFKSAMTYMEILPMGILFALITAIAMRRKVPKTN